LAEGEPPPGYTPLQAGGKLCCNDQDGLLAAVFMALLFVQCPGERKALCDPSGSLGLKRCLLVGYDSPVEVFAKGYRCTFR